VFSLASIRSQLTKVLHLQEPPHRTALAFALGVFIAFSPTYGLHTLSAIFFAWAFRLNFAAILLGNFVNNPWTTVPILGATMWTGFFLLGMPDVPPFSWDSLSAEAIFEVALPYILPFTLGACTLSLLGALIAYPLSLFLISRYQKQRLAAHDPASCSEKPA
jgi:uncharacterized protein (DUF2062 family)